MIPVGRFLLREVQTRTVNFVEKELTNYLDLTPFTTIVLPSLAESDFMTHLLRKATSNTIRNAIVFITILSWGQVAMEYQLSPHRFVDGNSAV